MTYYSKPFDSSTPANIEPIITELAPAANAFTISPEYFIPPSAIIGMVPAAFAHSIIALTCGTPTPAERALISGNVAEQNFQPINDMLTAAAGDAGARATRISARPSFRAPDRPPLSLQGGPLAPSGAFFSPVEILTPRFEKRSIQNNDAPRTGSRGVRILCQLQPGHGPVESSLRLRTSYVKTQAYSARQKAGCRPGAEEKRCAD